MELVLRTLSNAVDAVLPERLIGEWRAALPELQLELQMLAVEAWTAERKGLRWIDAAEHDNYPRLGKLHAGLVPYLQMVIPDELCTILQHTRELGRAGELEDVRRFLFWLARRDNAGPEGALCRFFLYEGVRLNLWVDRWREPELEAFGALRAMDETAHNIVNHVLDEEEMLHPDVRPLHVLVAAAHAQLDRLVEPLREAAGVAIARVDELILRASAARVVDVKDAILIRNIYAEALGETELGSRALAELHPLHLVSQNAVDQRMTRLRKRGPTRPRGKRVIDVILENEEVQP